MVAAAASSGVHALDPRASLSSKSYTVIMAAPLYTYPIRFTYKRLCDRCKVLIDCHTTVSGMGKVFYSGACGHLWDMNGSRPDVPGWLSDDRDFPLPGE